MNFKGLTALAFLCLAACAGWASGGELAAVITKRSGAYLEAFSAFQAAYGEEIASYDLASGKPDIAPGTRTVVAFGGKAASQDYPAGFNIIYCMAPGLVLGGEGREGKVVEVSMLPAAGTVLDSIKAIQPSVQRLAVFWMTPDFGAFGEKLKAEGALRGIIISPVRVKEYKELPGLLRGLKGSADAFWLV